MIIYASPKVWWLAERLSDGEGLSASRGDTVLLFCMTVQTEGAEYSIGDSALCWLWWQRQKGKLEKIVRKCNE